MGIHTQSEFWHLDSSPSSCGRADWDADMDYTGSVFCPAVPDHQRAGKRMPFLRVVLPHTDVEDFVHTWYGEWLIQDHVLRVLRDNGITGFEVKLVDARFAKSDSAPPVLWELVVTGWGGLGPTRVRNCAG